MCAEEVEEVQEIEDDFEIDEPVRVVLKQDLEATVTEEEITLTEEEAQDLNQAAIQPEIPPEQEFARLAEHVREVLQSTYPLIALTQIGELRMQAKFQAHRAATDHQVRQAAYESFKNSVYNRAFADFNKTNAKASVTAAKAAADEAMGLWEISEDALSQQKYVENAREQLRIFELKAQFLDTIINAMQIQGGIRLF